jgi:UDP-glucose 4-epimerase
MVNNGALADPSKAYSLMGWKAKYSDLETLIKTTWKAYQSQ